MSNEVQNTMRKEKHNYSKESRAAKLLKLVITMTDKSEQMSREQNVEVQTKFSEERRAKHAIRLIYKRKTK